MRKHSVLILIPYFPLTFSCEISWTEWKFNSHKKIVFWFFVRLLCHHPIYLLYVLAYTQKIYVLKVFSFYNSLYFSFIPFTHIIMHKKVSDVNDDVRRAAVTGIGFLLFRWVKNVFILFLRSSSIIVIAGWVRRSIHSRFLWKPSSYFQDLLPIFFTIPPIFLSYSYFLLSSSLPYFHYLSFTFYFAFYSFLGSELLSHSEESSWRRIKWIVED